VDYYATIISERNASEAADLLADQCRKKDREIEVLQKRIEKLRWAEAEIDKIKGIVGHPGERILPWDCPTSEVVRHAHHEWLRQTHNANQRVIAAEMKADKAEARVAELEATCAAMREAVESARNDLLLVAGSSEPETWVDHALEKLESVLSSDAGSKLLARLEATERVVEAARKYARQTRWREELDDPDWHDFAQALTAWEEGRLLT